MSHLTLKHCKKIKCIDEKEDESILREKKFITSPAEVNTHRKMQLQDAEVTEECREKFRLLCKEFEDVFFKDSTDIGRTPLITMDIDTGDSPPVCQKPYNLPLKHREWVQKELQTLEKAGVIVRSISPWASPIVVVPRKTEPGEPPRRRLCVDYRVINSLLPEVQKAYSKAKGVLTLVPLPQIDHIYAGLRGSQIFSTSDLRSGYHHMELSPEARAKSAFVTPLDKFEFTRCPFGLSQAPAYFQRLMNQVIKGLPFAFVYVMPPQSWGDRSDTKHSKCLLLGGRRLNQLTLIPKPKGSGGARAATAQVGPANKRNDTKRCLPVEASLRPGEAVPW